MKRAISRFAVFMAAVSLTSCLKDSPLPPVPSSGPLVFTATINPGDTKTLLDAETGKLRWEENDEIVVTDGSSVSSRYVLSGVVGDKASFAPISGQPELGDGPYSAVYGVAPVAEQTHSDVPGRFYMEAASSSTELNFTVCNAVMELNVTKSLCSVSQIRVSGFRDVDPTRNTLLTYTLTCPTPVDVSAGHNFYLSLPPGEYTKIEIVNSKHHTAELFSLGVSLTVNVLKPVVLGDSDMEFLEPWFSVGPGTRVLFAKGNLYWTGSEYKTESEQYDYRSGAGRTAVINSATTTAPSGTMGIFKWTPDESKAYGTSDVSTSSDDNLFTNETPETPNPDFVVNGEKGMWRTLSKDEFSYLLDGRTMYQNRYALARVNGVAGILIFPDNYVLPSGYASTGGSGMSAVNDLTNTSTPPTSNIPDWDLFESQGVVFLPFCETYNSSAYRTSDLYYWTSSAQSSTYAYNLCKRKLESNNKNYMSPIRLVRALKYEDEVQPQEKKDRELGLTISKYNSGKSF